MGGHSPPPPDPTGATPMFCYIYVFELYELLYCFAIFLTKDTWFALAEHAFLHVWLKMSTLQNVSFKWSGSLIPFKDTFQLLDVWVAPFFIVFLFSLLCHLNSRVWVIIRAIVY